MYCLVFSQNESSVVYFDFRISLFVSHFYPVFPLKPSFYASRNDEHLWLIEINLLELRVILYFWADGDDDMQSTVGGQWHKKV